MTRLHTPDERQGLRIVVLGYIVRGPLGGLAWHHLQYVMGLARLGHDVRFVEDSDDYAGCYDPRSHMTGTDPGYGLEFAARAFERVNLADRWAYYDAHKTRWHGPAADRIVAFCEQADVLLDVSGVNPFRSWMQDIPLRALIDTDPVFTQLRHLQDGAARERAASHNRFFSFGENFGMPGCGMPDDGFPWQRTRQPVVLESWPVVPPPEQGHLTTVMQWDSYRELEYDGIRYGMKSRSFQPYLELPRHTAVTLELAIGSPSTPKQLLLENGWLLRDPLEVTRDLQTYQRFIQGSRGEFSIAKQGYAVTRCGWFSERSANYLASGRPVLVQETGFSDWMNVEHGVLAFDSPDAALAGLDRLAHDYAAHCAAARAVAAEYFAAEKVLTGLLGSIVAGS